MVKGSPGRGSYTNNCVIASCVGSDSRSTLTVMQVSPNMRYTYDPGTFAENLSKSEII